MDIEYLLSKFANTAARDRMREQYNSARQQTPQQQRQQAAQRQHANDQTYRPEMYGRPQTPPTQLDRAIDAHARPQRPAVPRSSVRKATSTK